MSIDDWPPPIGSTVENPAGDTFEIVNRFETGGGTTVVLRHPVAGGWRARAVTRETWIRERLRIVR